MSELTLVDELSLDPGRAALLIQDMQNDVIIDGGAFAESGSPDTRRSRTSSPTWPTSPLPAGRRASR